MLVYMLIYHRLLDKNQTKLFWVAMLLYSLNGLLNTLTNVCNARRYFVPGSEAFLETLQQQAAMSQPGREDTDDVLGLLSFHVAFAGSFSTFISSSGSFGSYQGNGAAGRRGNEIETARMEATP